LKKKKADILFRPKEKGKERFSKKAGVPLLFLAACSFPKRGGEGKKLAGKKRSRFHSSSHSSLLKARKRRRDFSKKEVLKSFVFAFTSARLGERGGKKKKRKRKSWKKKKGCRGITLFMIWSHAGKKRGKEGGGGEGLEFACSPWSGKEKGRKTVPEGKSLVRRSNSALREKGREKKRKYR